VGGCFENHHQPPTTAGVGGLLGRGSSCELPTMGKPFEPGYPARVQRAPCEQSSFISHQLVQTCPDGHFWVLDRERPTS
jgi:hypothetical protein